MTQENAPVSGRYCTLSALHNRCIFTENKLLGAAIFSSVTNDESKCFFKPNYPIKIAIVTIALQDASFGLTPKDSLGAAATTSLTLPSATSGEEGRDGREAGEEGLILPGAHRWVEGISEPRRRGRESFSVEFCSGFH